AVWSAHRVAEAVIPSIAAHRDQATLVIGQIEGLRAQNAAAEADAFARAESLAIPFLDHQRVDHSVGGVAERYVIASEVRCQAHPVHRGIRGVTGYRGRFGHAVALDDAVLEI